MKKVTGIIVNYNTKELLSDCIKNLEGNYPNFELIVVDNDSPDDSADMVKRTFINEKYPWISLIEAPNDGLAASYNLGVEKAPDSDYFLFLGSDAFPEECTITEMVKWMEENPEVGIATAKLLQRDYSIDMDAHRGFPYPWAALTHFSGLNKIFPKSKIFNKYFLGWENMDAPHEIDLCISHFMLVKKDVFEKIGKWDNNFWLYGEDVDICWRAKQAGFKIFYLPMWNVIHYKGSSVGVRKTTADLTKASFKDKYKSHKASSVSMKKFYDKHWRSRYPKILTALIFLAIGAIGKYRLLLLEFSEKTKK